MPDDDVKPGLHKLLDEAMEKYVPPIELTAIEESWGDTLDDDATLAWLEEV